MEPSITIIVDSDVDEERLAELFASLSDIYSELSGGDELIIKPQDSEEGSESWR